MVILRENFQLQYGLEDTPEQTHLGEEHEIFANGNVKDKPKNGRSQTNGPECELVEESVQMSPLNSTRKGWSRAILFHQVGGA